MGKFLPQEPMSSPLSQGNTSMMMPRHVHKQLGAVQSKREEKYTQSKCPKTKKNK